jgi:hypothetical protein
MQLSKNSPQVSDLTLDQFQAMLIEVRDSLINDEFPKNAREINNGYCADFATAVWMNLKNHPDILFHNDEELADVDYSHTFLEFQDMYYDAECIEGTDDWTQLPTFHRQNND